MESKWSSDSDSGVDAHLNNLTGDRCNGIDGHPLNVYEWFSEKFPSKAWERGQRSESLRTLRG